MRYLEWLFPIHWWLRRRKSPSALISVFLAGLGAAVVFLVLVVALAAEETSKADGLAGLLAWMSTRTDTVLNVGFGVVMSMLVLSFVETWMVLAATPHGTRGQLVVPAAKSALLGQVTFAWAGVLAGVPTYWVSDAFWTAFTLLALTSVFFNIALGMRVVQEILAKRVCPACGKQYGWSGGSACPHCQAPWKAGSETTHGQPADPLWRYLASGHSPLMRRLELLWPTHRHIRLRTAPSKTRTMVVIVISVLAAYAFAVCIDVLEVTAPGSSRLPLTRPALAWRPSSPPPTWSGRIATYLTARGTAILHDGFGRLTAFNLSYILIFLGGIDSLRRRGVISLGPSGKGQESIEHDPRLKRLSLICIQTAASAFIMAGLLWSLPKLIGQYWPWALRLFCRFAAVLAWLSMMGIAWAQLRWASRILSDPKVCQQCGYSLIGLTAPRCPECGEPFDPTMLERLGVENQRGQE